MRNYLTKFFLLMVVSFYVAAKDDVVKVYDKGLDGNMRIYSIGCPNGKKTVIAQKFGEVEDLTASEATQDFEGFEEAENSGTDLPIGSDEMPTGGTTRSIEETVTDLKQRFLALIGQENKLEVCLYPIGEKMECKSYNDIDAAAQAACDLIR